jgi:uncharacterized protein YbaP (TraB family)
MNNIGIFQFCLLCSLINPISSHADSKFTETCKEFTSVSENIKPNENDSQIKNSRFKTGLLWKIETKQGKTNYLFGTIHSQDYAVSSIPPQARLALAKSKVLLMETIPNEAANQAFLNNMYFKDQRRLDTLLEPELFKALTAKLKHYGVEKNRIKLVKPWAAFSLIGRPKPVRAPTIESNLFQTAQQGRLQIKSLQSMDEIVSALDGLSMNDQIIILKDTICNHEQITRDAKTLVDLYLHRDLAGIVEFNNQPHHDEAVFERFMQQILYDRNNNIIEIIESEFENGNVFVAIGASHLADKKGLLNELNKRGYTLSVLY